jgi:hypothetical protein
MADAQDKQTTQLTGEKQPSALEELSAIFESIYSLFLCVGCGLVMLLLLIAFCSAEDKIGKSLILLAKTIHENWRASLILLFPTLRATWRRIEPRIHEVAGVLKFRDAPLPTVQKDATLPANPVPTAPPAPQTPQP